MNAKILLCVFTLLGANASAQVTATKIGSGPNVFNSARPFLNQITLLQISLLT